MVLVDISAYGLTGVAAERALEECGIHANRNRIPGDPHPPLIASGLRFGTNILAQRGMQPEHMARCANLVSQVLSAVRQSGPAEYSLAPRARVLAREGVRRLCGLFPVPGYPATAGR